MGVVVSMGVDVSGAGYEHACGFGCGCGRGWVQATGIWVNLVTRFSTQTHTHGWVFVYNVPAGGKEITPSHTLH
jgi:hypothetical protein